MNKHGFEIIFIADCRDESLDPGVTNNQISTAKDESGLRVVHGKVAITRNCDRSVPESNDHCCSFC